MDPSTTIGISRTALPISGYGQPTVSWLGRRLTCISKHISPYANVLLVLGFALLFNLFNHHRKRTSYVQPPQIGESKRDENNKDLLIPVGKLIDESTSQSIQEILKRVDSLQTLVEQSVLSLQSTNTHLLKQNKELSNNNALLSTDNANLEKEIKRLKKNPNEYKEKTKSTHNSKSNSTSEDDSSYSDPSVTLVERLNNPSQQNNQTPITYNIA